MAEDKINHPSHYTALSVEPIVLARHCDFCSGNVLKYILRSPFKGSMLDDLKKALWYLLYLQNHPHLYHTIDRWDGDAMDELTDGEREELTNAVNRLTLPRSGFWDAWISAYNSLLGESVLLECGHSTAIKKICRLIVTTLIDLEINEFYTLRIHDEGDRLKLQRDTFQVFGTLLELSVIPIVKNDLMLKEEAATPGTFWHKRLQERLKEIGEGGAHDASKQEA